MNAIEIVIENSNERRTVPQGISLADLAAMGEDDYEVGIELDELPIPKPIVNGSGFQPTIDSWQGVEIDVGM